MEAFGKSLHLGSTFLQNCLVTAEGCSGNSPGAPTQKSFKASGWSPGNAALLVAGILIPDIHLQIWVPKTGSFAETHLPAKTQIGYLFKKENFPKLPINTSMQTFNQCIASTSFTASKHVALCYFLGLSARPDDRLSLSLTGEDSKGLPDRGSNVGTH